MFDHWVRNEISERSQRKSRWQTRTRLLPEALRTRPGEVRPDDPAGRTYAEVVAANLIEIACTQGPGAVAAINEIGDSWEGRLTQAVKISDLTREIREKSDAELQFYLDNSRWPTDEEKALLSAPVRTPTT